MNDADASAAKVLLIGWDAADWGIIHPLLSRGQMPHLARLIARGLAGPLIAAGPLLSPTLWTTLVTGRHATDHQVLSSFEINANRSALRPVGRSSCRAQPLWEQLAGIPCHAINFPATHPAVPTQGVSISNLFAIDPDPAAVWPLEYRDALFSLRMDPSDIDAASLLTFVPRAAEVDCRQDDRLDLLRHILAHTATVHNAATWAMENVPWRFAAVCYTGIHQCSHHFMPFHPPQMDSVKDRDFAFYQHVVNAVYRFHDLLLGRLIQLAGEDTHVILVSDHGFHSDHRRPRRQATSDEEMLSWHRRGGIAVAAGPSFPAGLLQGATSFDVAPTVLQVFGLRNASMEGRSWLGKADDPAPCIGREIESNDFPAEPDADVTYLLDLGYVEPPDFYADVAEQRLEAARKFHLAEAWLDRRRPEEAVRILEPLAKQRGMPIDYRVALAHAYADARRLADCRLVLEELRRDFPDSGEALAALGIIELSARRATAAIELLRHAEARGVESPELVRALGESYLRLRLFGDAVEQLERAIKLDDESADAWLALSAAYLGRGDVALAIDAAHRSIQLAPQRADGHYRLGCALMARGRDACVAFEAAVAIDPEFVAALRKLSELAERAGDVRLARQYDQRAHLAAVRRRWGSLRENGTARSTGA